MLKVQKSDTICAFTLRSFVVCLHVTLPCFSVPVETQKLCEKFT